MSEVACVLLDDAAAGLLRHALEARDSSHADRACISWALDEREALRTLAAEAARRLRDQRSYQLLATLGYALHAGEGAPDAEEMFRTGLAWLAGRSETIAGETAPFVTDATALLGIAVGAVALDEAAVELARAWMDEFASRAIALPALEEWKRTVLVAMLEELDVPTTSAATTVATDVRLALSSRLAQVKACDGDEPTTLDLVRQDFTGLHPAHAALRLAALRWIRRYAPLAHPDRITPRDVVALLERVPAGLRRWAWEEKARTRGGTARQWHVDHEYHVQDLLYFLLAPFLPDLKDEEYFPSLGQKQPRTDLFVPSLRIVIEVKFLRPEDRVTKVIDEVGSDASLYLKDGSDYTGLIAFVWDDSRRTEEHPMLVAGLTDIRGVLGAVVVPRPGRMQEPAFSQDS